jgi:hypothetical protein
VQRKAIGFLRKALEKNDAKGSGEREKESEVAVGKGVWSLI